MLFLKIFDVFNSSWCKLYDENNKIEAKTKDLNSFIGELLWGLVDQNIILKQRIDCVGCREDYRCVRQRCGLDKVTIWNWKENVLYCLKQRTEKIFEIPVGSILSCNIRISSPSEFGLTVDQVSQVLHSSSER